MWAAAALLAAAGCQRDEAGAPAAGERVEALAGAAASRCPELGEGLLPPRLLELRDRDEEELAAVIERCLTVDEATARAFALGYAEREMAMQPPLTVRLVLPVTDSVDTLIARQVILSSGRGAVEGHDELEAEVAAAVRSLDDGGEQVSFRQIHEATAERYFTINVAAYTFRHPINWAHRGVPRWLTEGDELRRRCPAGAAPRAVLPAAGVPGAGRLVRYDCGGQPLYYSHVAGAAFAPAAVRTRHIPARAFRRWAERTAEGYDDPLARLDFLESLWLRYLPEGGRP